MSLTNQRFQIKTYPTPLPIDLVFYEEIESRAPEHSNFEYGQAHWDTVKYPHHVLIFVKPSRKGNGLQEWYYAANRENQDLYNWTHSEADIGPTKFDTITRDYLIRREDFNPNTPLQGEAMPDIPDGKFTPPHVLAGRGVIRAQEPEFDSLFVFERRTYVKKVPFIDIEISRETGTPYQVITTLYYRGEVVVDLTTIEDLVEDELHPFWALGAGGIGNVAKQLSENWWEVTNKQWVDIFNIYEWELDKRGPDKFYCPQGEETETVTTSGHSPGPVTPETVDDGQMKRIVKWGTFQKKTTITRIGELQVLSGTSFDQRTGEGFLETQELVEIDEVVESTVSVDGTIIIYEPYNGCLAIKITRKLTSITPRTWLDVINYEWPPVLQSIVMKTYPRRSGTPMVVPVVRFKQGYSGPQVASVTQYWQLDPPVPTIPNPMIPEGFRHQDCFYTIDVPPCLHGSITLNTTTGTTDPVWEFITETETFAATNYLDWPNSVTWLESKPYMGGYLVTEWVLDKPA